MCCRCPTNVAQSADEARQAERLFPRRYSTAVLPDIEVYEHVDVQVCLTHRLPQGLRAGQAINHDFDTWMPLHKGDEARQLRLAHNLCRNQQVFDAALGHHLGFAHLGDTAAARPSRQQDLRQFGALDRFQVWPDTHPTSPETCHQTGDVVLHEIQVDEHHRGIECLQGISHLRMIHSS